MLISASFRWRPAVTAAFLPVGYAPVGGHCLHGSPRPGSGAGGPRGGRLHRRCQGPGHQGRGRGRRWIQLPARGRGREGPRAPGASSLGPVSTPWRTLWRVARGTAKIGSAGFRFGPGKFPPSPRDRPLETLAASWGCASTTSRRRPPTPPSLARPPTDPPRGDDPNDRPGWATSTPFLREGGTGLPRTNPWADRDPPPLDSTPIAVTSHN